MSGKILPPWAMDRTRARRLLADDLYFEGLEPRVPCISLGARHKEYICSLNDATDYAEDLPVYHLRRLDSDIGDQSQRRDEEMRVANDFTGTQCPVGDMSSEAKIAAYKAAPGPRTLTTGGVDDEGEDCRVIHYLTFAQHKAAVEAVDRWNEWDRTRYDWRAAYWIKRGGNVMPKRFSVRHGLEHPDLFI